MELNAYRVRGTDLDWNGERYRQDSQIFLGEDDARALAGCVERDAASAVPVSQPPAEPPGAPSGTEPDASTETATAGAAPGDAQTPPSDTTAPAVAAGNEAAPQAVVKTQAQADKPARRGPTR